MVIVWDEPKRKTNLRVHGLDFADIADRFDFTTADLSASYGRRYRATNVLDAGLVTVVFAALGTEAISIISARPASRKERKAYAID